MPTPRRPHHAHETPTAGDDDDHDRRERDAVDGGGRPAATTPPGRERGASRACPPSAGPTSAKRRRLGTGELVTTSAAASWAAGPAGSTRSKTAARARLAAALARASSRSPSPQPAHGPTSSSAPQLEHLLPPSASQFAPSLPGSLETKNLPSALAPPPPLPELRTRVTTTGPDAVDFEWDVATPTAGPVEALHEYELTVHWVPHKDPPKTVHAARPLRYSAVYPLPRRVSMSDFPPDTTYYVSFRGLTADGRSTPSCVQRLPL